MKDNLDSENSTASQWSSDDEKKVKSQKPPERRNSHRKMFYQKSLIRDNQKVELRKIKAQEMLKKNKRVNLMTIGAMTRKMYDEAKAKQDEKVKGELIATNKVEREEKLKAKKQEL